MARTKIINVEFNKRRSKRNHSKSPKDTILAVYGGITIYIENYKCLSSGEYLNDLIIDFYLKYLMNEVLSEDDRKRTHVFSSQFYTRLSKPPAKSSSQDKFVMSEAERRHLGVQRWTKNVNIFEKDFIIIPIVEHSHWNLAIICYASLAGILDDDTESLIRPCILFFDSLYNKGKEHVAQILRGYLSQEYLAKMGKSKTFSNAVLKVRYPRVPHQSNSSDCGLYILQYVEQFFKYPIVDYTFSPLDLSEWFKKDIIKHKREEIANLISKLAKEYNPDQSIKMPTLNFTSDKLSSDEDLESSVAKKKNPFYKESLPGFSKTTKFTEDEDSCSSFILEKKKSDKRSSDILFDAEREGSPSSDKPKLSMDLMNIKRKKFHYDDLMDIDEENCHLSLDESNHNDLDDKDDVSLPNVSDYQLNNEVSLSSKFSQSKYKNKHNISIINKDDSDSESHLFRESSIFSADTEDSARPKRECRTKPSSQKMAELASKFKERKKKNELKERKASTWIDPSVFQSSESANGFSLYNANDEDGISPSTSYKDFKIYKKHVERIQQY